MLIKISRGQLKISGKEKEVVLVDTPYNPEWTVRARSLGGRWDALSRRWVFDPRDEAVVREAVREAYGTDGSETETVDIDLTLTKPVLKYLEREASNSWNYHGRDLAYRPQRDSPVRLGEGVRLLRGPDFESSGGSKNHPAIGNYGPPRTLLIRDVPAALYERDQAAWGDVIRLHAPQ